VIRLLDRYVSREFMRLFLIFAIGAPVLFVLGDLADNADRYMDRGLKPEAVALSYIFQFPLFVLYSFPIASLIGTIFTVNNMTRHSELAAAKAGGISFWRLLAPLPVLGVLLTLCALALTDLVPVTNRMSAKLLQVGGPTNFARTDFVYRGSDGFSAAIRRIDLDGKVINGLTLEREGDEPNIPSIYVKANDAVYDTIKSSWTLRTGQLRLLSGENERHFEFRELKLPRFHERPEQLLAQPKDTDEMRYSELSDFIEVLQRSGGNPLSLMVERAQKIAIPVATLIIILFGAPLANSTQRGGPAYGIGVSLAITIVYMMLFRIFGAAGATGTLPATFSAWLPNGLLLVAALVLTLRVKT
jgi:lipopolysaccharide export system permease protein